MSVADRAVRARPRNAPAPEEEASGRCCRAWVDGPGLYGWLTTTDHKTIGLRFVITAFVFFLLGGRLPLPCASSSLGRRNVLSPDSYNQAFTTHGTTMMFLFAVPVIQGWGCTSFH